jgi:diguanylate cyclase (GGDEF)-like protein/PAS domain S-box-containing protein
MDEATPGYNAAFVSFWFAGQDWIETAARSCHGAGFRLELRIDRMQLGPQAGFVVTLRQLCQPYAAHVERQRFFDAARQSPLATVLTALDGTIEYANPAFEKLTGWDAVVVVGRALRPLRLGADAAGTRATCGPTRPSGSPDPHEGVRRDGSRYAFKETVRPFVDARGRTTHLVHVLRDASEQVAAQARLAFLAHHDSLTGLPNRALFADRLRQELAHAARSGAGFAVLLLDLDRFKAINDERGHAAGDEVLRQVAARLRFALREADTVARLGGDEFALILSGAGRKADIEAVLRSILPAVQDPMVIEDDPLTTSASIGIARFPADAVDTESLLRAADRAMYCAKRRRNPRYCFAEGVAGRGPVERGADRATAPNVQRTG